MLTENIYNFRMDYPELFVPQLPEPPTTAHGIAHSKYHYPISPPHHHSSFDTSPAAPLRSAFTPVKSSTSGLTNRQSLELLHNFYAYEPPATSFYSHFPPSPAPSSHNSPTRPTSAAMIEQLMLRRSTAFADDHTDDNSTSDDDQRLIINDDETSTADDNHDPEVMCVEDTRRHMARQRLDLVQRTSVIKSVIDDDRAYHHHQPIMDTADGVPLVRSAVQRLSSDSCGASSACSSSSSASSADEDIVCRWNDCFRPFETLMQLATHVTHTHAIATPAGLYYCQWHRCPRAERGFNARYKMLVHVRTHTKEKPHRCNQCDKSFSRAENLKIHTRSHSGEKPYACPVEGCTKAYSNSSDRFKHTRTHSTEKPYLCKVIGCNKRYTDPSSLRKHVKTYKHSSNTHVSASSFDEMVQPYRMNSGSHAELMMTDEMRTTSEADLRMANLEISGSSVHRFEKRLMQSHNIDYAPTTNAALNRPIDSRTTQYTHDETTNSCANTSIDDEEAPLDLSLQKPNRCY